MKRLGFRCFMRRPYNITDTQADAVCQKIMDHFGFGIAARCINADKLVFIFNCKFANKDTQMDNLRFIAMQNARIIFEAANQVHAVEVKIHDMDASGNREPEECEYVNINVMRYDLYTPEEKAAWDKADSPDFIPGTTQ